MLNLTPAYVKLSCNLISTSFLNYCFESSGWASTVFYNLPMTSFMTTYLFLVTCFSRLQQFCHCLSFNIYNYPKFFQHTSDCRWHYKYHHSKMEIIRSQKYFQYSRLPLFRINSQGERKIVITKCVRYYKVRRYYYKVR